MTTEEKLIFSVFSLIVGLGVLFLTPGHIDSGKHWRGGKRDPMRWVLYGSDGRFRKWAKLGTVVYFVVFNVVMWWFF